MPLANEYEKLLQYLENQKPNKKTIKPDIKEEKSKKFKLEEYKNIPTVQHYKKPKKSTSKFFNVNDFEELMRKKLIEKHISYQNYERPYISVSELYNCLRQNYFVRKKYQIDIRKQYNFSYLYFIQHVGNTIHDVIQELYNFDESEKTVLSEKFKVKGRVDSIKGSTVFEIKSIDSSKFKGKAIKEHIFQGMVYAYILNTEYNYNIKNITIIYVIRTLKSIHPIDIDMDMKLGENLITRAPLLLDALNKNSIIDPIGATKEQCKWCSFRDKFCKNESYNQIKPPFIKNKKLKEEVEIQPKVKFLL